MSDPSEYRNNHYVPQWYQKLFLDPSGSSNFEVLDLNPDEFRDSNGKVSYANSFHRLGPKKFLREVDLYTTRFGNRISTEIEEKFFGPIDRTGSRVVNFWQTFEHPRWDGDMLNAFLPLISVQKLRTPKGLSALSEFARSKGNQLLFSLQRLQHLYCAHWTEAVWSLVDAPKHTPGFLLSDHPVTVYNPKCFPSSPRANGYRDPAIWLNGSQTIFPLSPHRALILTNLSWVRNPYGNPTHFRPNPDPFRTAMFNFQGVQTGRLLNEAELHAINYIIKRSALRYVASTERDWLFPERFLNSTHWSRFSRDWLLMPDPRGVSFSREIVIGWKNGSASTFDEYGRRPWEASFKDERRSNREWCSFQRFRAEFAATFGARRRGRSFELGKLDAEEDATEFHQHNLDLAAKAKVRPHREDASRRGAKSRSSLRTR